MFPPFPSSIPIGHAAACPRIGAHVHAPLARPCACCLVNRATSTNQYRENPMGRISCATGIDGKPSPRSDIGFALTERKDTEENSSRRLPLPSVAISKNPSPILIALRHPRIGDTGLSAVRARYLEEHHPSPITITPPHLISRPVHACAPTTFCSSTPNIRSRLPKCTVLRVHSAASPSFPRGGGH